MITKNLIISMLFLIALSCNMNKKANTTQSLKEPYKLLQEYNKTKDKKFLKESYKLLIKNPTFKESGLTNSNRALVLPLLMYLKKYDELENLLSKDTTFDKEKKEMFSNTVKSLKIYNKDSILAKDYINKNLKLINEKIKLNPKDSLAYLDYFTMRLYKNNDKQKTLKEIDSMQKINRVQSDFFYNYVLKDVIEDYPNEYLYEKK